MLDNIPIRKRLTGLLVLLGLTALLVFVYARQTFTLLREVNQLESRRPLIERAPQDLALYARRMAETDAEIRSLRSRKVSIQSHAAFINYAQGLCDSLGLRLTSLPVEEVKPLQDYQVASIHFSLEGNYADLLRFVYQLEQRDQIASVEKLSFNAENVRLNDQKVNLLVATLQVNRLLQNL